MGAYTIGIEAIIQLQAPVSHLEVWSARAVALSDELLMVSDHNKVFCEDLGRALMLLIDAFSDSSTTDRHRGRVADHFHELVSAGSQMLDVVSKGAKFYTSMLELMLSIFFFLQQTSARM
jgi:hypothetical protein